MVARVEAHGALAQRIRTAETIERCARLHDQRAVAVHIERGGRQVHDHAGRILRIVRIAIYGVVARATEHRAEVGIRQNVVAFAAVQIVVAEAAVERVVAGQPE